MKTASASQVSDHRLDELIEEHTGYGADVPTGRVHSTFRMGELESVLREVRALRTELTASVKRSHWQSIESAPVNVPVLVSGLSDEQRGRWVVLAIQDGGLWFRCYLDGRHNGAEVLPPIHWLDVPKDQP